MARGCPGSCPGKLPFLFRALHYPGHVKDEAGWRGVTCALPRLVPAASLSTSRSPQPQLCRGGCRGRTVPSCEECLQSCWKWGQGHPRHTNRRAETGRGGKDSRKQKQSCKTTGRRDWGANRHLPPDRSQPDRHNTKQEQTQIYVLENVSKHIHLPLQKLFHTHWKQVSYTKPFCIKKYCAAQYYRVNYCSSDFKFSIRSHKIFTWILNTQQSFVLFQIPRGGVHAYSTLPASLIYQKPLTSAIHRKELLLKETNIVSQAQNWTAKDSPEDESCSLLQFRRLMAHKNPLQFHSLQN